MTMLLIDAGNTRAKTAWLTGDAPDRTPTRALDYADLALWAQQLPQRPARILASNVAGAQIAARIDQFCRDTWGLPVRWCGARDGLSLLHNRYAIPTNLGADRWLGMLGLLTHLRNQTDWHRGRPALLASFGTATTLDALLPPTANDALPSFIGGVILPGPYLMAQSLAQGTAQLPLSQGHRVDFPRDTHDAIASGIAAAQAGAVLHQWQRLRLRASGQAPLLYACGGGWPAIATTLQADLDQAHQLLQLRPLPVQALDSPVLDGLACLSQLPGNASS